MFCSWLKMSNKFTFLFKTQTNWQSTWRATDLANQLTCVNSWELCWIWEIAWILLVLDPAKAKLEQLHWIRFWNWIGRRLCWIRNYHFCIMLSWSYVWICAPCSMQIRLIGIWWRLRVWGNIWFRCARLRFNLFLGRGIRIEAIC